MEDDTLSKLKQLGELRQSGILTEEEFAAQKGILLASDSNTRSGVSGGTSTGPSSIPVMVQSSPVAVPNTRAAYSTDGAVPQSAPGRASSDSTQTRYLAVLFVSLVLVILVGVGAFAVYEDRQLAAAAEAEAEAARRAEIERATEVQRQQAEEARVAAEAKQVEAEAKAAEAEAARIQAEEDRALAEAERAYQATAPVVSVVLTECDDSCASLTEDCTLVECMVTNAGVRGAKVTVNLVAGKRISTKQVRVPGGTVEVIRSKFKDSSAKSCSCDTIEILPEY